VTTPPDPRHGAVPGAESPGQSFSLYSDGPAGSSRAFAALVPRPPEMWAGAVFLTLAALPLVVLGFGLAVQPGQIGANLKQKVAAAGTSVGADTLITVIRSAGGVLMLLAVVMVVLACGAVRPSSRARLGVTVLAGLTVAGLIFSMIVTAPDPVSIGMLALAAAGAILLFLPRSEEFIAARR
jgi:hypothetical protein